MDFIQNEIILSAISLSVAYFTYLRGKYEGHKAGVDVGIESTVEFLRTSNMVNWKYDDEGEINLLDINGKEVDMNNL